MYAVNQFARVIQKITSVSKTHTNKTTAKYYDATTWPKHWGATEIELVLRGNVAHHDARPNYASLATLLKTGDVKSLNLLLRHYAKPPPPKHVDVNTYVSRQLASGGPLYRMPLVESFDGSQRYRGYHNTLLKTIERECGQVLSTTRAALQMATLEAALSMTLGSGERHVACVHSPSSHRNSVMWQFLRMYRCCATQHGRVLVQRFDRGARWWRRLMEDSKSSNSPCHALRAERSAASATDQGLCEMILVHVETVTGCPQDSSKYCDPHTAYATWMSETAWRFGIKEETDDMKPLIVLDKCDDLATHEHKFLVHTDCKGARKPYSLLEAFTLSIPSPYGIVLGLSNVLLEPHPNYLTMANVTNVEGDLRLSVQAGDNIQGLPKTWTYPP
ncbi:Bodo-specific multi-copy gene family, putative [Bodo saltans]|uniref:Bodo-specific multi-copy gene family, putative n=1 Tax=Bodo saltans TaxID=75058 RepID=A0A0S4J1G1_BODSA|nr:Bodo-specific multi-copy gene family, putative [Bodo saltans]|eukprot:CUG81922.1 Bodo-specific multi-copy gene family, putative [Bodo saltans]